MSLNHLLQQLAHHCKVSHCVAPELASHDVNSKVFSLGRLSPQI